MKNTVVENKFKEGDEVFERTNPSQKLIVTRFQNKIYYCSVLDFPKRKDLVFFERDLMAEKPIKG
ncbi:MAG: hypothetical protein RLO12_03095 [Fulvivirga sp.]|jgi:hypothetical protein|uniref:hypothetical protein n=1 Tax=Fulvivirga sp. TaxID=1931237 RepID=UPI0032EB3869